METVYISENAYPEVTDYISGLGIKINTVRGDIRLGRFTGDHPDLRMANIGGRLIFAREEDYAPDYPENAAFCAAALEKHLICRPDITAPELLRAAEGLALIPVRQGYAKCSTVVVDGSAIITADPGIYAAVTEIPGLAALRVRPGHVLLPGFREGFLGGASGRVRDELIFNGGLDTHPDGDDIRRFVASRGVTVKDFPGLPLRDIGSIIYEREEK